MARLLHVCVLLGAVAMAAAARRVQLDRSKLREMTRTLGVDSLLETASREEPFSMAASPADMEAGDFEIKCSTSCDFVKKGAAETASLNRGALIAAEDLAQSQRMLQRVVEQLRVDPDNVELQAQRENLQIEVADKTHTLQLAVGANVPDNSVAMEAANIQAKQKQLDELNRKLQASPADPDLQRQRDALQESIHAKDEALKAAAHAEQEQAALQHEVEGLRKRFEQLQDALQRAPDNALIKEEMAKVKDELEAKSSEADTMSPKRECYRVCVNPNTHVDDAAAQGSSSGRRLLSTASAQDVNNCIRMCVKVMRMLVYRMGKEFL